MAIEIHRHNDNVHIARALAIAEQRAFDPLSARHDCKLCRSHCAGTVVVRVQTNHNRIAIFDMTAKPLYLIGIDIGRRYFDCGRQVENDLLVRRRLPYIGNGIAYLNSEIDFGAGKAFGRILEYPIGFWRE